MMKDQGNNYCPILFKLVNLPAPEPISNTSFPFKSLNFQPVDCCSLFSVKSEFV